MSLQSLESFGSNENTVSLPSDVITNRKGTLVELLQDVDDRMISVTCTHVLKQVEYIVRTYIILQAW